MEVSALAILETTSGLYYVQCWSPGLRKDHNTLEAVGRQFIRPALEMADCLLRKGLILLDVIDKDINTVQLTLAANTNSKQTGKR